MGAYDNWRTTELEKVIAELKAENDKLKAELDSILASIEVQKGKDK